MNEAIEIRAVACCLILWFAGFCSAQESDQLKRIRQLRSDKSFAQALKEIDFELRQLESSQFAERVQLQIERLKCLEAQAFEQEDRQVRSQAIESLISEAARIVEGNTQNPNLILVRFQSALTGLRYGELLRRELEANGAGSQQNRAVASREAFDLLRRADRDLEKIDRAIAAMIPSAKRKTSDGALNQRELISLQNQVRYQEARSKINRGLLYGNDDPDNRLAILESARKDLQQLLPLVEKVDSTWWESRRDLIMCWREVGDFRSAQQLLAKLPISEAPAEMQLEIRAEAIRILLDLKDLVQAQRLIQQGRRVEGQVSADYDYSILEYLILKTNLLRKKLVSEEKAKRGSNDELKKQREELAQTQRQALETVKEIEKVHGAYWGRRANQLLLTAARGNSEFGSESLIRLAQQHYRDKEYSDSVKAFEAAAAQARRESNRKLELELQLQVLLIHRQLKEYQLITEKGPVLVKQFRDLDRAAVIDFLTILATAELIRSGQGQVKDYVKKLDFHLTNWPSHSTNAQVARFKAEFELAQKNYFESANHFKMSLMILVQTEGALDIEQFDKSMTGLIDCFEAIGRGIGSSQELNSFKRQFDGRAFFKKVFERTSELETTMMGWSAFALELEPADRIVVIDSKAIGLKSGPALTGYFIRLKIMTDQTLSSEERAAVIKMADEKQVSNLLSGFERDWRRANKSSRRQVAAIVNQAVLGESLKPKHWKLITECLVELGKFESAVKFVDQLLAFDRSTNKQEVHIELARLLGKSDTDKLIQRSIVEWRKIQHSVPSRSPTWFECRYEIARCHQKLGNRKDALAMLELMKAIPPGWSDSRISDQFDRLFTDLKSNK